MSQPHEDAIGLPALEARVKQDLEWLAQPAKRWLPVTEHAGAPVNDVVIIGAGMAGLAAAFALRLQGIDAVLYDKAPKDDEGPWATSARMETLRSPKHLTGPALDLPSLTFRAWYEAQFGLQAWNELDKIPRLQWADYLRWYRRVLALDVRNDHTLTDLNLRNGRLVELTFQHRGQFSAIAARKVILATGMDAFGGPSIPDFVAELPKRYWAHSEESIDFAALAGRRVAVVGGSATAMDVSATALEAGAAGVEILIRRPDFPRVNRSKGAGNPGFESGYPALPDAWKWRLAHHIASEQIPPPHGSTLRVSRHKNAWFNFNAPVQRVEPQGGGIVVHTPQGEIPADFLILATGYQLDWNARPEFRSLAGQVKTWEDAWRPPADQQNAQLARYPYLGADFALQPKHADAPPALSRLHCFSYPAHLSNGHVVGLIPGISHGARTLAQAIAGQLYVEDSEYHYQAILDYDEPELLGDEWRPATPYAWRQR
ncbi:NAD(P)/FAD-dependent oxidoreductase [Brenneria izadpanahii]|uniref:NAD(P)/FAD-dependent oxidoreductase n=1 Tax=Brenneria izadpanahii TaxID=2722756 RepID=A0ABX7UWG5_9GAMM|nr:NAD(P)/FAD-dependent oxidoreductase [Brenneria izadpanahii]QTF08677.1 NAD(P)/FAD-dependent oxidoreductase [Brenneria izadpanahii]